MPTYIYKARDETGKLVKGAMPAVSKDELADKLHKMGYMATQLIETGGGIKLGSWLERLKRISTEDMVMFNVQLSNMINAGVSITASLNGLNKQIENKKLNSTVGDVLRNIEGGDSFSAALARHPQIFPRLLISMVKAGEASGRLGPILSRFAEFYEHQAELRRKIKGALFYPAILLCAGVAVTLFIVTFIIPQFAQIFLKSGIRLPLPTLILYTVGQGIKQFAFTFILFVVVCVLAIRYYINTDRGRVKFDGLKLRLPIIGRLFRKTAIARFSRTLATLLSSGVPILESLNITKGVVGNAVLARVIGNVHNSVEKGEGVAASLKLSAEFPQDVIQMLQTGEDSGRLDELLNKIADFYDLSLEYTIKKLTTIIEPLFLVIMGSLVGFIMASMLMPIFDMMRMLRH